MTQEIFSVNYKFIKKAVSSIKRFKPEEIYMYGDGSEVYLYCWGLDHCKYVQYKIEDVKIENKFCFATSLENLADAVSGSTGEVVFTQHTDSSIEIDANTKRSYIAMKNVDAKPDIKFKEDEMYEISADRIEDFGKCLNSNFISSWSIIDDFYYMHVDNISERVLSPNMLFYKSTSPKELELSIPGFIIKNINNKVDVDILVDGGTCRLISGNLSVDFKTYYSNPTYAYRLSEHQSISLNTAKLIGVITAMDKASSDDIIEVLYQQKANAVVFQSENAKYKLDQPVGLIKENTIVRTSCSNFKKALEFLSNNEIIKMKLFIEEDVIKGIELGYDDGNNLEYVVISAKR